MQTVKEHIILDVLPSQVLSVLQFCALSDPLLSNLKFFQSLGIPSYSSLCYTLFLSLQTTTIGFIFFGYNLPKAMVPSMVVTFSTVPQTYRGHPPGGSE